jgi:CMP-N-acetylneuraminic acid synthetase
MSIACFLPCREGSKRVPAKNVRPFAGVPGGLTEIKLRQLAAVADLDEIVVSTDDQLVMDVVGRLDVPNVRLHRRDSALAADSTSTDDLVAHALELIPEGDILWTHVTSPFLRANDYQRLIQAYRRHVPGGHDSLMTVTAIQGFLWTETGPLNYDRSVEKWPRTQTLPPVYEVNSGAFIASAEIYERHQDRIGARPYLAQLDGLAGMDIDWQDDFELAEALVRSGHIRP